MLPDGIRRLFRLGRGAKDVASEVDAELTHHFAAAMDQLIGLGMTAEAARSEVEQRFGDRTAVRRDLVVQASSVATRRDRAEWWHGAWQDVRWATRGLARTPRFTAAVVLMLGLGMGGAAAMFGVLDRLLLRPPSGVSEPERLRLVYIHAWNPGPRTRVARPFMTSREFTDLQAAGRGASDMAAFIAHFGERSLEGRDGPSARISLVSGDFFRLLGPAAVRGRFILPEDDREGAPPTAVISYGLWTRHFGADPAIVGRALTLDGTAFTIVGVAPPGFSGLAPDRVDVWLPLAVEAPEFLRTTGPNWREYAHSLKSVVRLAPGIDALQLDHALQGTFRATAPTRMSGDTTAQVTLESVLPGRGPGSPSGQLRLTLVVGGVAAVLCLISVANVTLLLLLRAAAQQRETAVRLALGISRARLFRALVAESLLLGLLGATAACGAAMLGGELLRRQLLRVDWQAPLLDARLFVFTLILGLAVGCLCGTLPGLHAGRTGAIAALKAGLRVGGRVAAPVRTTLLVLQAAMTVALLAGFGLFARSFLKATTLDFGVDVDRLVLVHAIELQDSVTIHSGRIAAEAELIAQRLRALPGIQAVTVTSTAPLVGHTMAQLRIDDADFVAFGAWGPFLYEIDASYLAATGLHLVRGRAFTAADIVPRPPVALVGVTMAAAYWPNEPAVGKCLYVSTPSDSAATVCRQIVGVVSDFRDALRQSVPLRRYYLPLDPVTWSPLGQRTVLARSAGDPELVLEEVRAIARSVRPTGTTIVRPLRDMLDGQIRPYRTGAALFAWFAALAVILASAGLYSAVAYSVTQRRHELGIRIAIGAQARHIIGLVVRQAVGVTAAGLVLGLTLSVFTGRVFGPLLFELAPRDPLALGGAALGLIFAAILASFLPARAATRVDPREALQAE